MPRTAASSCPTHSFPINPSHPAVTTPLTALEPDNMAPNAEVMFHNFSFDAASSRSHYFPSTAPSSVPSSVTAVDLDILAAQFSQQSLSSDPRTATAYNYPVNYQSSQLRQDYYPSSSSSSSSNSSSSVSAAAYSQYYSSSQSLRAQRQASTRLQTDPAYARQIASLADRMTASGESCYACQPQPQQPYGYHQSRDEDAPDDDFDDEGIDMTSEDNAALDLSYRRSTDFSSTGGRIQRIGKYRIV
jgi:hypothetical protein